jgi:hypothetical protein
LPAPCRNNCAKPGNVGTRFIGKTRLSAHYFFLPTTATLAECLRLAQPALVNREETAATGTKPRRAPIFYGSIGEKAKTQLSI